MNSSRLWGKVVVGVLLIALVVACGSGASEGGVATGPAPSEMCESGTSPMLAAYDLDSGKYEWSVCTTEAVWRTVARASDGVVTVRSYPQDNTPTRLMSFDAATGAAVPSPQSVTDDLRSGSCGPDRNVASMLIDDVCLTGGQDDPFTAYAAGSGKVLWTEPNARLPYDDVWAVGDGAVYLVTFPDYSRSPSTTSREVPHLAAFEIRSGKKRWERDATTPDVPWYAAEGVLFTIWTNLALISTNKGSSLWQTNFPDVQFPRISGVRSNRSRVFISFTMVPSGGD